MPVTEWWDERSRAGFVHECDEFGLDGCVGCGDDVWLNDEAWCWECWQLELAERNQEKLEEYARTLIGKSMGISLRRRSLDRIPRKLVLAKAESLRAVRLIREMRRLRSMEMESARA